MCIRDRCLKGTGGAGWCLKGTEGAGGCLKGASKGHSSLERRRSHCLVLSCSLLIVTHRLPLSDPLTPLSMIKYPSLTSRTQLLVETKPDVNLMLMGASDWGDTGSGSGFESPASLPFAKPTDRTRELEGG